MLLSYALSSSLVWPNLQCLVSVGTCRPAENGHLLVLVLFGLFCGTQDQRGGGRGPCTLQLWSSLGKTVSMLWYALKPKASKVVCKHPGQCCQWCKLEEKLTKSKRLIMYAWQRRNIWPLSKHLNQPSFSAAALQLEALCKTMTMTCSSGRWCRTVSVLFLECAVFEE